MTTDLVIHIQPLDKFSQTIFWELANNSTCLPIATYLYASKGSVPYDILPQQQQQKFYDSLLQVSF